MTFSAYRVTAGDNARSSVERATLPTRCGIRAHVSTDYESRRNPRGPLIPASPRHAKPCANLHNYRIDKQTVGVTQHAATSTLHCNFHANGAKRELLRWLTPLWRRSRFHNFCEIGHPREELGSFNAAVCA